MLLRRAPARRVVALRTAFLAPPFRLVFFRDELLRAVDLRAEDFRAPVFLRDELLRAVDFRAVFLRAVLLRAVDLRALVFLRPEAFRFEAAFLVAIGTNRVLSASGVTSDARRNRRLPPAEVAYLIPLKSEQTQLSAGDAGNRVEPRPTARPMMSRVLKAAAALCCAVAMLAPLPSRADVSQARALSAGLLRPANAELQSALRQLREDQVAQANPIGTEHRPLPKLSLPQGFSYTLDANVTWPLGNVGFDARLPGGIDAVAGYGLTRTNRFQIGYYELSEYPVGFSNASVPFYVQGLTGPGTTLPNAGLGNVSTGNIDATVKNKILTVIDQNLFQIGRVPIVISPTYLARSGTIGGHSDEQVVEFNGFPTTVRLRTVQHWLIPVTLPFLSTPRMFGTLTVAPEWLVHRAGLNQTNHAQIFELLYLEYHATKQTTFFVQPSRLIDYLPSDPYPEYVPTVIAGISHRFTPSTFVQMSFMTGAATNRSPYGITSLTCQHVPCTPDAVVPSLGGLHAAQAEIQFGIGAPSVIPL